MPSFQQHKITFEAETTLRGDELTAYVAKKFSEGRLRVDAKSITVELQKKPRKAAETADQTAKANA